MIRSNSALHPHISTARLSLLLCPLVAFGIGFAAMLVYPRLDIDPVWAGYLSLAVIAGIDSVLGGVRAGMEAKFHSDVFLSGFVVNTVVAVCFAWFGDVIGIQDVYLAGVLVFGWRILTNTSLIRRFIIERARAQRAALHSALSTPPDAAGAA